MRIGLIADIHGNLLALEAVLSALGRDGVDDLICLGDVASLGPQPAEVIARLRALGCPVLMGNTDARDRLVGGNVGTPGALKQEVSSH